MKMKKPWPNEEWGKFTVPSYGYEIRIIYLYP